MFEKIIHTYSLNDPRQMEDNRAYWRDKSAEERLDAVEELRRQFGKFPAGKGYGSSLRLRRVLRIVQ